MEPEVAKALPGRTPAGIAWVDSTLFALDPLLLPAVLFALLTVAPTRGHRAAAVTAAVTVAALVAEPYIRGGTVSFAGYSLSRLAAAGAAVSAGLYLRARRNRRAAVPPDSRPA